MARKLVIGDLRVQAVQRGGGRGRSFTIVWPDGAVHEAADRFLRGYEGSGTQRTYAYLLLDHLRWLEREALAPEMVSLQDLRRYMAALGAAWRGPYGQPWRAGRRPFGQSALSAAAACVKAFYLQQALLGVNPELGSQLQLARLPSRADRQRAFLGHVRRELPANPLAPPRQRRRHPRLPPEKHPWRSENGTVTGGLIKRASPAMIHAYFEYVTTEYPADAGHGMLLVQLHGGNAGQPWAPDAARGMLRRAGERAGLGKVIPHAFRHGFATAVLDASGGNLVIARDAGGWASTTVVSETYAHADVHDPAFDAALRRVWGEQR